ncbi:MAG: DUF4384 domain-containing protein [Thermodesulfovibrionales bacterium]|nr:DUF4384 domain-containing protein [Thermodesulfovibrionales bacterium]
MAISVSLSLMFSSFSIASDAPLWVEAGGEAYLGEIDTPKEVKERAKRDADGRAVEQAVGTFIRSHTLVSNSQLAEDLVYASVRGKIEKVEVLEEGWDKEDKHLYRVRIRALIEPVYPEKGGGISVKLSLSKTDLREGEEVRVFYQASRDCHVYVFSVAADGSVTLLLPNSLSRDNAVKAEQAYEFPPAGSRVRLKAQFLPGYKERQAEEKIKLIATTKKEDIIPLGFQEGFLRVYDAKSTGLISDLVKRLNQLEPSEWAEATAVYTISR